VRQLRRQIGSLLYERTGQSTNKKAVIEKARKQERQQDFTDLIRDPYVLKFTGLAESPEYLESDLESALLTHLQSFLLELGAGFCFEARQKRITVGRQHDYIDLVSNALYANPKPEPFPMLFPRHHPSFETSKSPQATADSDPPCLWNMSLGPFDRALRMRLPTFSFSESQLFPTSPFSH